MTNHRVKELREKAGITQKELAEHLGVSKFHMNRIENGNKGLTITLAIRIAEKLDVTLDDIFLK